MIIGPQGSGKTTQAKIIAQKLRLCLIKTGDLVRTKALDNDEVGLSLKETLEQGKLADDKIVAALVKERLEETECQKGFVVDGYPRRMSQLKEFDPKFDLVFCLNLSDQLAYGRMLKRGRMDDTKKLIKERLRIFRAETKEVIDFYKHLHKLIEINGEGSVDQVEEEISNKLRESGYEV